LFDVQACAQLREAINVQLNELKLTFFVAQDFLSQPWIKSLAWSAPLSIAIKDYRNWRLHDFWLPIRKLLQFSYWRSLLRTFDEFFGFIYGISLCRIGSHR
jgi:hypothetical protein